MPRYELITKTGFAAQAWRRYDSYAFAATDAVAPLVMQELAKACTCLPIAFIQQNDAFVPHAVQGLEQDQNLFVVNGTWVAPYTPAAYRGYPFALAQGDGDDLHLCIDMDSGLVGEGEEFDQPFFDETGEPAQAVKDVLNFLEQVHRNRAVTERMCAALAAEELIQPWPLKVQTADGERDIEGLFRVDEARLNSLEADALHRVHAAGALPMVYCQLLSMSNIQTLGMIARKLEELKTQPQTAPSNEVDIDGFFKREGTGGPTLSGPTDETSLISIRDDAGDFDLSDLSGLGKDKD